MPSPGCGAASDLIDKHREDALPTHIKAGWAVGSGATIANFEQDSAVGMCAKGTGMRYMIEAALVVALIPPLEAVAGDVINRDLIQACSQKTVVMGRDENKKLVRAGEKLDGFCTGYLQATFDSIEKPSSCRERGLTPEFLLSVYEQYMKDKNVPEEESASRTLILAFQRIAGCN
jgi:hypothetical protein